MGWQGGAGGGKRVCEKLHTHTPARFPTGEGSLTAFRQLRRIICIMLNLICNDYSALTFVRYNDTALCHIVATF